MPLCDQSLGEKKMSEASNLEWKRLDPSEIPLSDIDLVDPRIFHNDFHVKIFERLRKESPVHYQRGHEVVGSFWNVTRYQDIMSVDTDPATYSSEGSIVATDPEEEFPLPMFIAMDPPKHTEQRKTVRSVSAPSNLRNIEPMIRERTAELLDSLPEGETFDWVNTVSIELTTLMLATLFDFPMDDRHKLARWSDIVFAIPGPGGVVETQQQKIDELLECVDYFGGLFEQRRENPGFDLVSMLANGDATKDIPMVEQLGNLLLLIVGGNDTTRNTMTGSVYGLNKFPDQYDKLLANPDLIANFVPEVIRWQTPLAYMRRTANHDTELGGKQIKKNDQVLMWYVSANQDEDVFENAHVLDIERHNADRQLSFGYGIHFCMGSRVAELQLRILWEEILQRFKRIEIQDEPERVFSSFVHGYSKLPVTVTRR